MRPGDGEPVLLNMTWLPTQMPYRRGGLQNNRSNRYLPLSTRGRVDIVAPRSVVAPRSANELADELEIGRSSGSQGTQGSALRSTVHRARLGIRHPCVGVRHPCVGARHPCVGTGRRAGRCPRAVEATGARGPLRDGRGAAAKFGFLEIRSASHSYVFRVLRRCAPILCFCFTRGARVGL